MPQILFLCSLLLMMTIGCSKNNNAPTNHNLDSALTNESIDEKRAADAAKAEEARQLVTDPSIAAQAVQHFGIDLFETIAKQQDDRNIILSPWSVESALMLTAAGARHNTLAQMLQALGFQAFPDNPLSMHSSFSALSQDILKRAVRAVPDDVEKDTDNNPPPPTEAILHTANAIWVATYLSETLQPEFKEILTQYHQATVHNAPFKDDTPAAIDAINQWVSDRTRSKIPQLVDASVIKDSTKMVLTNAVYFQGDWTHAFDPQNSQDELFTLLNGEKIIHPLMHQTLSNAAYWSGKYFRGVNLPYESGGLVMRVVVPDEGQFRAVRDQLFTEGYEAVFLPTNRSQTSKVEVTLPRFQARWEGSLADNLEHMGMTDAFANTADFSSMFGRPSIKISDVIHKVFIDVDEHGTEAAAATAVVMVARSAAAPTQASPRIVRADRPFLFAIADAKTATPIFIGQVMNPTSK